MTKSFYLQYVNISDPLAWA